MELKGRPTFIRVTTFCFSLRVPTAEKRQKMSVEMADEKPKSGHHVMNRGPTEKKTVVDDFGEGLHRPFISTARKKL